MGPSALDSRAKWLLKAPCEPTRRKGPASSNDRASKNFTRESPRRPTLASWCSISARLSVRCGRLMIQIRSKWLNSMSQTWHPRRDMSWENAGDRSVRNRAEGRAPLMWHVLTALAKGVVGTDEVRAARRLCRGGRGKPRQRHSAGALRSIPEQARVGS